MKKPEADSWIRRKKTRRISLGSIKVGGNAPVSVQTMTKADTRDVEAVVTQIRAVQMLGCDVVRLAVVDADAAKALREIRKQVAIPLVADIHFDHKLALRAIEAGVDGLRINPGNIGSRDKVGEVVKAARERKVPIRIGVNSGSLEGDLLEKYGHSSAKALVESAMRHVRVLEDLDYREIKISVKASDVRRTVEAYRLLSSKTDYPLHLGVTEAGTFMAGTIRTSLAIGILLADGIGDTIRVSLTDTPAAEVRVGLELLRSLGLRKGGAHVISCPTCGRIQVDVMSLARQIEEQMDQYYMDCPEAAKPIVAVMGCMVNGPGEAREADIALAGGNRKMALYVNGKPLATVTEKKAVNAVMDQVRSWKEPS
jgi:(E)-4-hydroxy-3-methylbut-2-enyl-diphosphate synthase